MEARLSEERRLFGVLGLPVRLPTDIRLLSLDVFDTALMRVYCQPDHVFCLTEQRLAEQGFLIRDFALNRRQAEQISRETAWRAYGRRETTLDSIYRHFEILTGLPPHLLETAKHTEIAAELESVRADPAVLALFRQAGEACIPVVFVSDMYLPRCVIEEMLAAQGYVGYVQLFLSSDSFLTKGEGRLFQVVLDTFELAPDRVMHIGDNPDADVAAPAALGIRTAIYGHRHQAMAKERTLSPAVLSISKLKAGRWSPALEISDERAMFDYLGRTYGPLIHGSLVRWIVANVIANGNDLVLFFSRDGYFLKKIYDLYRMQGEKLPPSVYCCVSRYTLRMADFIDFDERAYDFLLSGTQPRTTQKILQRCGLRLEPGHEAAMLLEYDLKSDDVVNRDTVINGRMRQLLRRLEVPLRLEASRHRVALENYLSRFGLKRFNRLAVVDLGWSGNLQCAFETVIRRQGFAGDCLGYYLGLAKGAIARRRAGHHLFGFLENYVLEGDGCYDPDPARGASLNTIILMELLHAAPHGGVCGYEDRHGAFRPCFVDNPTERRQYTDKLAIYQEAVLQTLTCRTLSEGDLTQQICRDAVTDLCLHPSPKEAEALGNLVHFDGVEHVGDGEAIAPAVDAGIGAERIREAFKRAYWPAGFLVRNSAAAQLAGLEAWRGAEGHAVQEIVGPASQVARENIHPLPWSDSAIPIARPLRICFVTEEYLGYRKCGGIGTAVTAWADALAEAGHQVTVLFTGEDGRMPPLVSENEHLVVRRLPPAPAIHDHSPLTAMAQRVFAFLAENLFDVVHFHDWLGRGYCSVLGKRQNLALRQTLLCVTAHGSSPWVNEANFRRSGSPNDFETQLLERQSMELADVCLSPSRYMVSWMAAQGWSLPLRTYHMPYRAVLPPLPTRGAMRESSPPDELVFFGRLEGRKGVELFCDALDLLVSRSISGFRVTFLGMVCTVGGETADAYIRRRQSAWPFPVHLLTDRDRSGALAYLTGGRGVAIIPSPCDNSPNTVYECLAANLPFLASDAGGIAEIVSPADRNRVLFTPTALALAEKLITALAEGVKPAIPALAPGKADQAWLDWHASLAQTRHWQRAESVPAGMDLPRCEPDLCSGLENYSGLGPCLKLRGRTERGSQFKVGYPKASQLTFLVITHYVNRTGAPIILLHWLRWLKMHTDIRIRIIQLWGGELLPQFEEIAPVLSFHEDIAAGTNDQTVQLDRLKKWCPGKVDLIFASTAFSAEIFDLVSKLGAPVVTQVHELEYVIRHVKPENMNDMRRHTARYIAGSPMIKDNLVARHGIDSSKIDLIYEFIEPTATACPPHEKDALRHRLDLPENAVIILGCGSIEWRKGPDLFIDVAKRVRGAGLKQVVFFWLGAPFSEPIDTETLIAKNGLSDSVFFIGAKENPKDYFQAGDIFLLTSREDCVSLVGLEACECGLPVICFKGAGDLPLFITPDIGAVVDFEDTAEMAATIMKWISNEEWRFALGLAARAKLLATHVVDRAAPHLLKVCLETIESTQSQQP